MTTAEIAPYCPIKACDATLYRDVAGPAAVVVVQREKLYPITMAMTYLAHQHPRHPTANR